MAKFKIDDPVDGGSYIVEANTMEEADASIDEMKGGNPWNFDAGFNPGTERNTAAFRPEMEAARPDMMAAADERMHGEADSRGFWSNVGNSLMMDTGDEVMGLLAGGITFAQGKGFDEGYTRMTEGIRNDIDQYSQRHPVESTAVNIGAGAVPMIAGGIGAKIASKAVPAIGKLAAGAGRVATSGAGGAVAGGISGYASGEGGVDNRLESGAVGTGIGAVTGAGAGWLGNKIGQRAGNRAGAAAAPTRQQNKSAASSFFQQAENSGVGFGPNAMADLGNIRPAIMGPNVAVPKLLPGSHDNAIRALSSVENLASQPRANFSDIMTVRGNIQDFVDAARGGSKDQAAALRILDSFDAWFNKIKPRDLINGNVTAREAMQMWGKAKELWGLQARTAIVEKIVDQAKKKSTGSFGNNQLATRLRKGFTDLIADERRFKWFSTAEKKAIEWAAKGGNMGTVLGAVDALTPGVTSVARGAKAGVGLAAGALFPGLAPIIAGAAVTGTGARVARNIGTKNAAKKVETLVGSGGTMPFDAAKAKASGDYAQRLIQAAGQPTAGEAAPGRIDVMFPNDLPGVYR